MEDARIPRAPLAAAALLLLLPAAGAFNLAPEFARVLSDPRGDPRSYFGFSVALRQHGLGAEIVVGAPRANDFNASSGEVRPGAVYMCDAEGRKSCVPLLSDRTGIIGDPQSISNRENGGLGTAMSILGNAILVCAPRWMIDKKCKGVPIESRVHGICYLTSNSSYPANNVTKLYPFTKCDGQIFRKKYYFIFAEGGMSVQILKNLSEIILGAPGIMHWKGAVLRYRFGSNSSAVGIDIPCPTCYVMQENSYLGYAVSHGKFTSSGDVSYVSSAPRAADNKGKILVFNFEKEITWRYQIIKEREGTQLGEYFGASLCVADFNKDGLDDLLVGAPQHSVKQNTGDEGCIYVLLSTENGWKDLGERGKIAGSDQAGARFGTAIGLLGDINLDGYPDVAVGAPYENNRQGAIYIYHGNKNGISFPHSQKIIPSEKLFLRGFGASISRGLDVDGNYMNDLAVGAYISGHAVLIKTYPVVTILIEFIPSVKEITFTSEEFEAKLCFSYLETYQSLNVDIVIALKLDQGFKRVSFSKDRTNYTSDFSITLESRKDQCQNFSLFIKSKIEFSKPIELSLEYKLKKPAPPKRPGPSLVFDNKSEEYCSDCVVLNPERSQKKIWHVRYIPDSAPADLHVTADFINVTSPYIIGTSSAIEFKVVLCNNKEQAMESSISVIFPLSLLKRIPKSCQENFKDSVNDILELICDVESPFLQGKEHRIDISLDMTEVPSDLSKLNISVVARSRSLEEHQDDNIANLLLTLKRFSELEIHGKSVEYTLITSERDLNDEESGEQDQVKQKIFKHNYQVMNDGPSPAEDFKLFFEVPRKILQFSTQIEVLSIVEQVAYLGQQPLPCSVVENIGLRKHVNSSSYDEIQYPSNRTFILSCSETSVLCTRIKCSINSLLPKSSGVKISFALKVMTEKLGAVMGLKDIILIRTSGHIETPAEKYIEVQSVVWTKPPTTTVDMGMIAICIACGCLILLTFILLLIKCGFFTRQDPMEKYFRKKAALALKTNTVPSTTFYSPRGSIMVF